MGHRPRWRRDRRRRCRKRALGGAAVTVEVGFPPALTASVIPPASPLTPATVALGQKLFLTAGSPGRHSRLRDVPRSGTRIHDGRPTSVGIHGRIGQRNAPTVLNALYNKTQFWDGRVNTLEQQAALPITNPFEMGSASIGDAVSKIAGDKDYQEQFMQAFGRGVNEQDMLRAIATYERTLVSFDSPFDHFIAGDNNAISDSAKSGWELFNTKARCNLCHALTENERDVQSSLIMIFITLASELSDIMSSRWRSRQSAIWRTEICRP